MPNEAFNGGIAAGPIGWAGQAAQQYQVQVGGAGSGQGGYGFGDPRQFGVAQDLADPWSYSSLVRK